ncbi:MAG: hypothetical protein H6667_17770 [Ardenticatenaceae bacterium]|nr:hypothetical protein [Ardenticatenaceae bacterium]
MAEVDFLLTGGTVVTMNEKNMILFMWTAQLLCGSDNIITVGPVAEIVAAYSALETMGTTPDR